MRFASKAELIEGIEETYRAFVELTRSIPKTRYREAGVWGDDWTLQDLLWHLTEWHRMCLGWYREGRDGGSPALPAAGYKWNQTPALNRAIWLKHRRKTLAEALGEFETSHEEILSLVRRLSPKDLLAPGRFAWTGQHPLTTYLAPNTSSHYRWATKVLKRWLSGRLKGGKRA